LPSPSAAPAKALWLPQAREQQLEYPVQPAHGTTGGAGGPSRATRNLPLKGVRPGWRPHELCSSLGCVYHRAGIHTGRILKATNRPICRSSRPQESSIPSTDKARAVRPAPRLRLQPTALCRYSRHLITREYIGGSRSAEAVAFNDISVRSSSHSNTVPERPRWMTWSKPHRRATARSFGHRRLTTPQP
jgi:hypothetical protein